MSFWIMKRRVLLEITDALGNTLPVSRVYLNYTL